MKSINSFFVPSPHHFWRRIFLDKLLRIPIWNIICMLWEKNSWDIFGTKMNKSKKATVHTKRVVDLRVHSDEEHRYWIQIGSSGWSWHICYVCIPAFLPRSALFPLISVKQTLIFQVIFFRTMQVLNMTLYWHFR